MSETPLYVRLPTEEAERLDRAAAELRTSKRELVTRLLAEKLDDVLVGHAEFRPYPPADVLTAAEAADLLQTAEGAVLRGRRAARPEGRRPVALRPRRAVALARLRAVSRTAILTRESDTADSEDHRPAPKSDAAGQEGQLHD